MSNNCNNQAQSENKH